MWLCLVPHVAKHTRVRRIIPLFFYYIFSGWSICPCVLGIKEKSIVAVGILPTALEALLSSYIARRHLRQDHGGVMGSEFPMVHLNGQQGVMVMQWYDGIAGRKTGPHGLQRLPFSLFSSLFSSSAYIWFCRTQRGKFEILPLAILFVYIFAPCVLYHLTADSFVLFHFLNWACIEGVLEGSLRYYWSDHVLGQRRKWQGLNPISGIIAKSAVLAMGRCDGSLGMAIRDCSHSEDRIRTLTKIFLPAHSFGFRVRLSCSPGEDAALEHG